MVIRTFYWEAPLRSGFLRRRKFRFGNAGDAYNVDALNWAYPGNEIINTLDGGKRLLLVGSVAHRAQAGDLLSGVGCKAELPPAEEWRHVSVHGVRGPRTLAALQRAGADTSSLRFMGDPGLLARAVYPAAASARQIPNQVAFIPHFRERHQFRDNNKYKVINIDAPPETVVRQISESEHVYSSSLHGIIWAHALGRPVQAVSSLTGEPEFKYHDYYESLGLRYRPAGDIDQAVKMGTTPRVPDLSEIIKAIQMPSMETLRVLGIASDPR
jgi:pyruvyltransferase